MAIIVQRKLTKMKPIEAGEQFGGKQHTISVQIDIFAPGDDMDTATPFSTDVVSAPYEDIGQSVPDQVALTQAILLLKLQEINRRRDREYKLWVAAAHDTMIEALDNAI